MSNLIAKISVMWLISLSTYAEVNDKKPTQTTHSEQCPESFYALPLISSANFCQQFANGLPASLSYHAPNAPQATKQFYLDELGKAEVEQYLKGRIILNYSQGNKIIIISTDGQGSQIDILVKVSS